MEGLVTPIIAIISAALGYFIKYFLDSKKELKTNLTNERREIYQMFIDLIMDMFAKQSKTNPKKQLTDFYKKYLLYASPAVIRSFSDYFQFMYSSSDTDQIDTKRHLILLSTVVKEMRNDLGLDNSNLGENCELLFKAKFTDYNRIMSNDL